METYTADDPENQIITWSVSDTTNFAISTGGVLTFRSPPDFESRNSYPVTGHRRRPGRAIRHGLRHDQHHRTWMKREAVTLNRTPPQVERPLTAQADRPG